MRIAGVYSFKGGKELMESEFRTELQEIEHAIAAVKASTHKKKVSKEKTMRGKILYKPGSLNKAFKAEFEKHDWHNQRVPCDYPTDFYAPD